MVASSDHTARAKGCVIIILEGVRVYQWVVVRWWAVRAVALVVVVAAFLVVGLAIAHPSIDGVTITSTSVLFWLMTALPMACLVGAAFGAVCMICHRRAESRPAIHISIIAVAVIALGTRCHA